MQARGASQAAGGAEPGMLGRGCRWERSGLPTHLPIAVVGQERGGQGQERLAGGARQRVEPPPVG